jgi:hypothetical protein
MNSTPDYYPTNEDKFGFLVFDKKSIDTFLAQYSMLETMDIKFIEAFKILQNRASSAIEEGTANPYANHANAPESSNADLTYKVLDAVLTNSEEKYFSPALRYLFFYQCLPKEFQYKWLQTFLGDFQFNVTFFRRLRYNSKNFDHICCGEGYRDKDISKIWGDWDPNEIVAEKAKDIKASILQSEDFNDRRFQIDKEHFLEFLDNVITGKWRLFLLDWN